MQNAGLVDEKGDLKEGSHLIFSALDGFRLGIEGEPSPLWSLLACRLTLFLHCTSFKVVSGEVQMPC
jgi:hypothetical protein